MKNDWKLLVHYCSSDIKTQETKQLEIHNIFSTQCLQSVIELGSSLDAGSIWEPHWRGVFLMLFFPEISWLK